MSINIFKGVELSIPKLRESLKYACAGDQFLAGTKNIWWLFFCVDCLPVLGQVTLLFLRSARLLEGFSHCTGRRCFVYQGDHLLLQQKSPCHAVPHICCKKQRPGTWLVNAWQRVLPLLLEVLVELRSSGLNSAFGHSVKAEERGQSYSFRCQSTRMTKAVIGEPKSENNVQPIRGRCSKCGYEID